MIIIFETESGHTGELSVNRLISVDGKSMDELLGEGDLQERVCHLEGSIAALFQLFQQEEIEQ